MSVISQIQDLFIIQAITSRRLHSLQRLLVHSAVLCKRCRRQVTTAGARQTRAWHQCSPNSTSGGAVSVCGTPFNACLLDSVCVPGW